MSNGFNSKKDFDYHQNYDPFSDYEILTKNGLRRTNRFENRHHKTDITFIDGAMKGEIYYDIPSHSGFKISNHGRVLSVATTRNLKIYVDRWGVRHVKLPNENGSRMDFSIQKLMREVFYIPRGYKITYFDNDLNEDIGDYDEDEGLDEVAGGYFDEDEGLDEVAGGYFGDENGDFEDI